MRKLGTYDVGRQEATRLAARRFASDPNFIASQGGLFGALAFPVRLHLGVMLPR